MITRFHYDRDTLARFLDEAAPEIDSDIAVHLEQCNECQSTLESLLGDGLTIEAAGELLRDGAAEQLTYDQSHPDRPTELDRTTFLEPSDHPESLGRFARFEIMEVLGRGGMGIVMRGYDTSLNRHSAVKVLAPELATSAAARKRFSREAKSAAAVVHAHVVPIQTVDEHNGLPYLVMPVVEGQSVDARVRNSGPVTVIEAVRIASQIAEGLAAAHAQGLVHRDIKPANVLLENGVERVQITDFGLARAIDDASMTRSGVIAGTPQYMSPEQAHGDSIDHRSDLFSLGSLIYFMLTGHSPFRAETTMGVLNRIGNEQPRSLRSINPDIPEWFEQIVMKLLAKPCDDRFQTASEVAELLQSWHAHLQQPDIVDRPQKLRSTSTPRAKAGRSRGGLTKWLVATAAFGFLAFAGVFIVLELDKGTLTIESEADDVPIRIMQGEEVVKRLTVTKKGTSVRVATGKYVVLIDGEFSDIQVEPGAVTLGRRETKAVRIVQSRERAETIRNASEELGSQEPTEILTPEQVLARGQLQVHASELGLPQKVGDSSVTVRFRVGSVSQQIRYADYSAWYLCSSEKPSELGLGFLKVWISPSVEAALKVQGITDLEAKFAGKTVTISGPVTSTPVLLHGGPASFWNHSMELETLDQLTVLEVPSGTTGSQPFNTPKVLATLRGRWQELDHEEGEEFNQTLVFSGGALGQWYERAQTLPISITYYVEGAELILQFNHEPEAAFDYRMKQLRFDYKLDGDSLLLTREGVTTRLQRIRDAIAEPMPAQTSTPTQPAPYGPSYADSPQPTGVYQSTGVNQSTGVTQPSQVRTLADHVNWFNRRIQAADGDRSQPPLTVDELICFAQWKLQTVTQLSVEQRHLFTDLGIGRWLPEEWSIQGGESLNETSDGELDMYRVELVSRFSGTKIVVRHRHLSPPVNFQAPVLLEAVDTAMPLTAALTEFNAIHYQVDGLHQPTLTIEEVVAAILDWKSRRSEAPVDNETFAKFQEIAKTHQLPADAELEVLSSFQSSAGDTFKIWSVRLLMPQSATSESTYAFTIREQYLSVNSALESKIHWGKPNDEGLQAGFRLIPGQRAYQVGNSIETEFFYRSISGKSISASLHNIFAHQELIARDADGKDLDVVETRDKTVGGAMATQVGEAPTKMRGKPLELGYITPDPQFDSLSPGYTYLTVKGGQKVFLTYVLSDFNGGELSTGEVVMDIAETSPTILY